MDKKYYLWYNDLLDTTEEKQIDHKLLRGKPLWDLWKNGYSVAQAISVMFPPENSAIFN